MFSYFRSSKDVPLRGQQNYFFSSQINSLKTANKSSCFWAHTFIRWQTFISLWVKVLLTQSWNQKPMKDAEMQSLEKNIWGLFCIKAEHVVQQEARWALHLSDCFTFPKTKPTPALKTSSSPSLHINISPVEMLVESQSLTEAMSCCQI